MLAEAARNEGDGGIGACIVSDDCDFGETSATTEHNLILKTLFPISGGMHPLLFSIDHGIFQ